MYDILKGVGEGKVKSITGDVFIPPPEEPNADLSGPIHEFLEEAKETATRAIVIVDGPDLGIQIRGVGFDDLASLVGTLQMAGFLMCHEAVEDE